MAGVPPNVAQSRELSTLTKHSSDLCRGITRVSTVTSFAQSLEQEGFITLDAKSSILNTPGISDQDKCVRLLDAVKEQVRVDPAKFDPIVDIFRSEPALSFYADMLTATRDIEAWKCTPSLTPHNSSNTLSPVQSHGIVDQASIDYGVMMAKLIEILENYKNSLNRMKTAFEHMAHHMEHEVFTDIVQSEKYRAVVSVIAFFQLLARYLKTPDCSLLRALVCATNCERANQILQEYLDNSSNLVLDNSYTSPPDNAPESKRSVITSEPIAESDCHTVPITVRLSVDKMSWGMLRHAQSLLCGLFRVPQFALQLSDEVKSGSVIMILWTTSMKIAVHMQSVMLDDGDMKLLLQERFTVKVQVGKDYKISVGKQDYWKNLECILCDTIAEDTEQTQLPTRMEAELTKTILSYSKQQIKTRQRETELEAQIMELAQVQQQLKQPEQSSRGEMNDVKWKLQSSEALVANLQKNLQQLRQQSGRREISDLKQQLQSSQDLVAELKKTLQHRDAELETLRSTEQSNRKEVYDLKGELRSSKALVAGLQNTLQQRDLELDTVRSKETELVQANEELRQQEQSSRREIDDLKKQVQSSEALVADLKKKALQQRDLELDTARPKPKAPLGKPRPVAKGHQTSSLAVKKTHSPRVRDSIRTRATRSPVSTVSLSSGTSRAASPAVEETMHTLRPKIGNCILTDDKSSKLKVGDRVTVGGSRTRTLKFGGTVKFAPG